MIVKQSCLTFEATLTVYAKIIWKLLRLIPQKLCSHESAKVVLSEEAEMQEYSAMIQAREQVACDVICFVDGLSCHSEYSLETIEQNSCLMDTMVNQWLTM